MLVIKPSWSKAVSAALIAVPTASAGNQSFASTIVSGESNLPREVIREVLYDQLDFPGSSATPSQNFEAAFDAYDCFAADDFVVPEGETWEIDQVDVNGAYFNGNGTAPTVNLWFYTDTSGLPGAPVYTLLEEPGVSEFELGDFVIPLFTRALLPSGTFWLVVQANLDTRRGGEWRLRPACC